MAGAPELSEQEKQLIENRQNRLLISAASLWEINIKTAIGKLKIAPDYVEILREDGFEMLEINWFHTQKILYLPTIHNDPFDRMLIAQAITENAKLVTRDKWIKKYPYDIFTI